MGLKSKLVMTMATSAAGAAMIAGGTFALFTASTTNGPNTFTAGTVKITDTTGGSAFKSALYVSNMAPGDTENGYITIKNDGSLGEWVAIRNVTTNKSEVTSSMSMRNGHGNGNGTGGNGDEGQSGGGTGDEHNDGGTGDENGGGKLATLFDGTTPLQITYDNGESHPVYIPSGESRTFVVHYKLPLWAGNEYQGLSGVATFNFEAVQSRNNTNANGTGPNAWQ